MKKHKYLIEVQYARTGTDSRADYMTLKETRKAVEELAKDPEVLGCCILRYKDAQVIEFYDDFDMGVIADGYKDNPIHRTTRAYRDEWRQLCKAAVAF